MEIIETKSKVSRPWSSDVKEYKNDDGDVVERFLDVTTPNGIINVVSYNHGKDFTGTRLSTVMNGYMYDRSFIGKFYSAQYCVTLADRFSSDLST